MNYLYLIIIGAVGVWLGYKLASKRGHEQHEDHGGADCECECENCEGHHNNDEKSKKL